MTTSPQRRTRGSGSIRERMKGVWQIRYDGAPDVDGNTNKVAETIRGSKRDAERILRERLGTVDSGSYVTKQKRDRRRIPGQVAQDLRQHEHQLADAAGLPSQHSTYPTLSWSHSSPGSTTNSHSENVRRAIGERVGGQDNSPYSLCPKKSYERCGQVGNDCPQSTVSS